MLCKIDQKVRENLLRTIKQVLDAWYPTDLELVIPEASIRNDIASMGLEFEFQNFCTQLCSELDILPVDESDNPVDWTFKNFKTVKDIIDALMPYC